jgi:hypothetical protein
MIGLGCLWLSSLLEIFHYAIYSHNGIGDPLAHAIAQCLRVGAQVEGQRMTEFGDGRQRAGFREQNWKETVSLRLFCFFSSSFITRV